MTLTRIFLRSNGETAKSAFALLENHFEEEGLSVALWEVDEDADIHEVSVYVQQDAETKREEVARVIAPLHADLDIQLEDVPDIDWVTHSLQGLHAVKAGRFYVHGSHDAEQPDETMIPILIEAGLAFGTGHHGTTSGCLEMIEQVLAAENPRNALDLGTGSAVLAIAVAKLREIPILATDIDPVAVDVAQENVVLNGVDRWVRTETASGFDHPVFAEYRPLDLIIANILAGPLKELAPELTANLSDGGSIILSGILDSQHDGVLEAYQAQGCQHIETFHREGWVTIHLKR